MPERPRIAWGTRRRAFVAAGLAWPLWPAAAADDEVARLLREGGAVIAFRHALAPGTFDPPGFKPGVCSTQRNLSDEGRAQARRIGEWFQAARAEAGAGALQPLVPLPGHGHAGLRQRRALGCAGFAARRHRDHQRRVAGRTAARAGRRHRRRGRPFEVWVTHMFVLSDLAGTNSASGEGLVLRADGAGGVKVLARLQVS